MKLSETGAKLYNSYRRVSDWVNNSVNDFSLFSLSTDNSNHRLDFDGNNNFGSESELLSISQQHKDNKINSKKERRKFYQSCAKLTRKQLKLRQLPKLFEGTGGVSKCRPSKSVADLNTFINNIDMTYTHNKKPARNLSFNQVTETNNSHQHYLSPDEGLYFQEPLDSLSELFSNTDSDPDWTESKDTTDLLNAFSKNNKRKKLFKLDRKNVNEFNFKKKTSSYKTVNRKKKKFEEEKKTVMSYVNNDEKVLSRNETHNKRTSEDIKQKTNSFRTFHLRTNVKNVLIHKAKSIQEANEIYNNYKKTNIAIENSEKKLNSCVSVRNTTTMHNDISQENDELLNVASVRLQNNDCAEECSHVFQYGAEILSSDELQQKSEVIENNSTNSNVMIKSNNVINEQNIISLTRKDVTEIEKVDKHLKFMPERVSDNKDCITNNKKNSCNIKKSKKITRTIKNKKNEKQKIKSPNRSSISRSPGWSNLNEKMKELNVRQYKYRRNCLEDDEKWKLLALEKMTGSQIWEFDDEKLSHSFYINE